MKAIDEVFNILNANGTYVHHAKILPKTRPLPTGVILKLRRDARGRQAKFKARTVARGKPQADAEDYTELHAGAACIEIIGTVLAVAATLGFDIEKWDVKGAFLNARLPFEHLTWIKLSKIDGIDSANGQWFELIKYLFGLCQAAKLWSYYFVNTIWKLDSSARRLPIFFSLQ